MKSDLKKITFSLPMDLYTKLAELAEKENRSVTGQLIYIVRMYFSDAV